MGDSGAGTGREHEGRFLFSGCLKAESTNPPPCWSWGLASDFVLPHARRLAGEVSGTRYDRLLRLRGQGHRRSNGAMSAARSYLLPQGATVAVAFRLPTSLGLDGAGVDGALLALSSSPTILFGHLCPDC